MTRNDQEHCIDQLSAYMDGELDAPAFERVDAHLSVCGSCRSVLEDLTALTRRAGELGPREPSRDLWAGIESTIRATAASDPLVIELPTAARPAAGSEPGSSRRRISVSPPQAIAAGIALVAASSVFTWSVGQSSVSDVTASPGGGDIVQMASTGSTPPQTMADEIARLEVALQEARSILDPNTIRVLERNLAVVEAAIADSERALALDPGNAYLVEHLDRVYERKLTYLRDASQFAEWES